MLCRLRLRALTALSLLCAVAFSLAGLTLHYREPLCTELLDSQSYESYEGYEGHEGYRADAEANDSVQVVTWATSDTGYLRRLRASAAWQGYPPPHVLGMGTPWRGPFHSKLVPLVSFLPQLGEDLVVVLDYDAFLQQGPEALRQAYRENCRPGNVWISAEALCNGKGELPYTAMPAEGELTAHDQTCYPFPSQRPKTHGFGPVGSNRFVNAGFTVGPASQVRRFWQAVLDAAPVQDQSEPGVEQWWAGRLHAAGTVDGVAWAELVDLDSAQRGAAVVLGTQLMRNQSDSFGAPAHREVHWSQWVWRNGVLMHHIDRHVPIAVHFPNQRRREKVLEYCLLWNLFVAARQDKVGRARGSRTEEHQARGPKLRHSMHPTPTILPAAVLGFQGFGCYRVLGARVGLDTSTWVRSVCFSQSAQRWAPSTQPTSQSTRKGIMRHAKGIMRHASTGRNHASKS